MSDNFGGPSHRVMCNEILKRCFVQDLSTLCEWIIDRTYTTGTMYEVFLDFGGPRSRPISLRSGDMLCFSNYFLINNVTEKQPKRLFDMIPVNIVGDNDYDLDNI